MYIHADMRGSGTLLLALDGVLVGLVVEADTLEGWIRRYDTRQLTYDVLNGTIAEPTTKAPSATGSVANLDVEAISKAHADYRRRVVACPIVRVEGKVDFVGDTATDPDWMIAQRLVAVRIRHGLPVDASVAHDTSALSASILERLASQLRLGTMTATNVSLLCSTDALSLDDDKARYVQTGAMHLALDYVSVNKAREYETAKAEWVRDYPGRTVEHIVGPLEETQVTAVRRIRTAELNRDVKK